MPIFRSSSSGQKGWMTAKQAREIAERRGKAQRRADFKAAKKGNQAAADRGRRRGR